MEENRRHEPRKLRNWIIFGFVVVLAALIAGLIMRRESELDKRFAEIRAAGYPVTLQELNDWYTIPEGEENAADVYVEAFSYYFKPSYYVSLPVVGDMLTPKRNERLDGETMKLIEDFLSENEYSHQL